VTKVSPSQGAALLELFRHARSCPGRHQSARHARVCASAKFVMLHARDCNPSDGPCPVEWCGAVKKLLRHVVRCQQGAHCVVCKTEAAHVVEAQQVASNGAPIDYWQSMSGMCDDPDPFARAKARGDDARRIVG